ncbi:hypothetical protein IID22_04545, partial [Patescibacteria group bacterium]|nr:hypothetical protein [Patescibacteria group bacterium]
MPNGAEEESAETFGVPPDELEEFQRSQVAREENQRGQARTEALRSSTEPDAIRTFVRKFIESYEDPHSIFFHDRYSMAYAYRTLEDRKSVFELTNKELEDLGVKGVKDERGRVQGG